MRLSHAFMACWRFYPAGGMKDCYFVSRTSMPSQRPQCLWGDPVVD